eukprot:GHVO01026633.1.p1 GENE.GHVO01026633.1~~GHVO01026633.1.p1  ORF type:complete len:119 (+),score=9.45 GHVO01026633.1:180-536(+)
MLNRRQIRGVWNPTHCCEFIDMHELHGVTNSMGTPVIMLENVDIRVDFQQGQDVGSDNFLPRYLCAMSLLRSPMGSIPSTNSTAHHHSASDLSIPLLDTALAVSSSLSTPHPVTTIRH